MNTDEHPNEENISNAQTSNEKPRRKHWSGNPWILLVIMFATMPLFFVSQLVSCVLFVVLFLYICTEQRHHGMETVGTFKPAWSTLGFLLIPVAFCAVPIVHGALLAFRDYSFHINFKNNDITFDRQYSSSFGFVWLGRMLKDPEFIHVLWNTISISLVKSAILPLFMLPLALFACILLPAIRSAGTVKRMLLFSLAVTLILPLSLLMISTLASLIIGKDPMQDLAGGNWYFAAILIPLLFVAAFCVSLSLRITKGRILDSLLLPLPALSVVLISALETGNWFGLGTDLGYSLWIEYLVVAVVVYLIIFVVWLLARRGRAHKTA